MPKPSDGLPLDVVEDWCCSYHFSYFLVPDHVSPCLVDGSSQATHLTCCYLAFHTFGQGPRLALVGQSRDKYRVYEFGFCLHGDIRMFEEGGKLVADAVCLLDSEILPRYLTS